MEMVIIQKKKKIVLIAIVIMIATAAIYFFTQYFAPNSKTFLTAEGKWIAEQHSSDQRIIDYYDVEHMILNTKYDQKSSVKRNSNKLLKYAQKSKLKDAQKRMKTIQEDIDVIDSADTFQDSFYSLIPEFANHLVGGVYAEKYECQYTLPVDSKEYMELMNSLGYTYKKTDATSEIQ